MFKPYYDKATAFIAGETFQRALEVLYKAEEVIFLPYTFIVSQLEKRGIISKP
jgi:hypothetical protein